MESNEKTVEEILLSDAFMDKFVDKFIEKAFPSKIESLESIGTVDCGNYQLHYRPELNLNAVAEIKSELNSYEKRKYFACKVCGNVPDETGLLEHGRGCFVVSEDGGGTEWIHMGCDHDRLKVCPACQSGELKETDK